MPLLKQHTYTSEDYWNLPDSQRAELIDGQLYNMAPPSRMHQRLVMELSATIRDYIRSHHGSCQVYPAPFAVNLDADDKDWVEPDISVICDNCLSLGTHDIGNEICCRITYFCGCCDVERPNYLVAAILNCLRRCLCAVDLYSGYCVI